MKQHISKEQAQTVTMRQTKALRDAGIGNYKDLTIGKMIEILESTDEFLEIVRLAEYIVHLKSGLIYHADNLCDALWDAVKATL